MFQNYKTKTLKKDILSGIIVALVSIPISMGYAQVAGLPVVYGLYGSLLPILVFSLITSSPQFVFGVDATPAALVGATLASLGIVTGSGEAIRLVPVITLVTAPRICSWGHFKCKDTGFEFLFFNLHMDHIGKKARVESAYLVQEKMKELGKGKNLPAILTGDFNVDQTHQSYDAFVNKGVLCDSYEKCDFRYAMNGTFNSFDLNSFTESRIDHIFVSPSFQVKRYGVLTDTYRSIVGKGEKKQANDCPEEIDIKTYQARTPSDHFPVKVELEFDQRQQK